jgi:6-phosphogluconolactonase (cycloisomerase 2 family)
MTVDRSTGSLTLGSSYADAYPVGVRSVALAMDPAGKYLYASRANGELTNTEYAAIAAYSIDPASGALTALPGVVDTDAGGYDPVGTCVTMHFDPSGKYLYCSSPDANGGLYLYSFDSTSGALTPLSPALAPAVTGATPEVSDIAFTPNDQFAYAITAAGTDPVGGLTGYGVATSGGALTLLSTSQVEVPAAPTMDQILMDPGGQFAYVNSPQSGIEELQVQADGSIAQYAPVYIVGGSQEMAIYPYMQ